VRAEPGLNEIIRRARGEEQADLLLAGGEVVNVFSGEVLRADVAICGELIVGVGEGYEAEEVIDLTGKVICPGFIDGHLHIESSMLTPYQFARAVLPHGTTAVVCDPHEIANVLGLDGIRYMLDASEDLPLTVFVMAPSCVPATGMETAGANLTAGDLVPLFDHPRVLGLAEMMNFPGVLFQDPEVLRKLAAAGVRGLPIDGHSPGLTGRDLQAYIAAGARSDHECTSLAEAREKLRAGMYIFIREGTTEQNLAELLPVVTPHSASRCLLVSDDRHPDDLMSKGHMDYSLRLAVYEGLDPVTAIRMVTLSPAERFRLFDRGAVAPGYRADLVVLSGLESLNVEKVFSAGRLVSECGDVLQMPEPKLTAVPFSINIAWEGLDLSIRAEGQRARVIGLVPGQIVTECLELPVKRRNGFAVADPERDISKLAVIERHHGSGNVGLGFVQGLGLARGAIAGSVAHDSHNIIVAGVDDADMIAAARAVAGSGGGLAVVAGDKLLARLPLPVAGLMSEDPLEAVRDRMAGMLEAARALGSPLANPFMTLSFLALPVIPALKLTDRGLVDVGKFDFVPLFL
jgi:adenine deaminase